MCFVKDVSMRPGLSVNIIIWKQVLQCELSCYLKMSPPSQLLPFCFCRNWIIAGKVRRRRLCASRSRLYGRNSAICLLELHFHSPSVLFTDSSQWERAVLSVIVRPTVALVCSQTENRDSENTGVTFAKTYWFQSNGSFVLLELRVKVGQLSQNMTLNNVVKKKSTGRQRRWVNCLRLAENIMANGLWGKKSYNHVKMWRKTEEP